MKTVAIAQARMGSTRFPGKVMKPLNGRIVLDWVITALRNSPGVDEAVIATSLLEQDDVIADWCVRSGVGYFRGSETDVLDRFYKCAIKFNADVVLRLTCDCPFLDPQVVGQVIQLRKMTNAAYCSNNWPATWPDGLDTECFTFEALEIAWKEATRPSDRDCVTQYIIRNRDRFPAESLICPFPGMDKERWVLDTERDYDLCQCIAIEWGRRDSPSCTDILRILHKNPGYRIFNKGAIRNERFYQSLSEEELGTRTFERSNALYTRATKTIPFGSQTFSKSAVHFPSGAAPLYVSHGDGAYIYDVDGNDYVDLVNALLPVVLGYRDIDVDYAVRRQLSAGMSFSLATKLECELSEKLCDLIPCAEMVKFGKSGTDVTSAAVRLARAWTGVDHVLVGGYHGWADWSMATVEGKNHGIPDDIQRLSHAFKYGDRNDIEWWNKCLEDQIAAIVVEPMGDEAFLIWLRHFCARHGIVLIFDEIKTGFRYSMGGAQKYFGVKPDLACFGKSMGNGMPISALVGQKHLMSLMKHPERMFYSGTFFGDTLGLAAALATIEKMEREHVIDHLWKMGGNIREACGGFRLTNRVVNLHGFDPLVQLSFTDHQQATAIEIKSFFIQEMAQNGVLVLGENGVSYAHKEPEIHRIVNAYRNTLYLIDYYLENGTVKERIKGMITASPLRKTA